MAEGPATWAILWPCVHEFLAIVTHPRIYAPPTPLARALDHAWRESPTSILLAGSSAHWPTLRAMVVDGRITGAQVQARGSRLYVRQHGVRELWSADRDFSRCAGLAVVNPLVGDG